MLSRIWRAFACALFIAIAPAAAVSAETACPQFFAGGVAPDLLKPELAQKTRELCFGAFAVLHSGVAHEPIYSAEHLTDRSVRLASRLSRQGQFHPEPKLPSDERAELKDYAQSGYDRGHMAPNHDMPNRAAQAESFSLANMVPQSPPNNRGLWAQLEEAVRALATRDGEVYVISGPIFEGENVKALHGRVLVPTELFKAVYDPKCGCAGAYVVENAPGDDYRVVSIDDLEKLAGIDPFPSLSDAEKAEAAKLPNPGGE